MCGLLEHLLVTAYAILIASSKADRTESLLLHYYCNKYQYIRNMVACKKKK